jgi:hypothetical protein
LITRTTTDEGFYDAYPTRRVLCYGFAVTHLPSAAIYFDRHTISLKKDQLSMYTLDGHMHFQPGLQPHDETRFFQEKLREYVLVLPPNPPAAPATEQSLAETAWHSEPNHLN